MREGESVNGRCMNWRLDSSTSRVYQLSEGEGRFEVYCLKDGTMTRLMMEVGGTSGGSGWVFSAGTG